MALPLPESVFSTTTEVVREPSAWFELAKSMIPIAIGGASTLGVAGVAWGIARLIFRKRKEPRAVCSAAPFPHKLDEARELRTLAFETEGRVPEYDALVGRTLDDEIQYLMATGNEHEKSVAHDLAERIHARVRKIAPPHVKPYLEG